MSQENVEIVRRTMEAFIRGDDDFSERFDADVEWTTAADEPDPQTYRGIEGIRSLVRVLFDELWERDFEVLSIEFIDADPHVVVLCVLASRLAKAVSSWKPRRRTSTS